MSAITDEVVAPSANNAGSIGALGLQWGEIHANAYYESGIRLARLVSPTFTGTPAAPTATPGTNTTQIATTAFVTTARVIATGEIVTAKLGDGAVTTVKIADANVTADKIATDAVITAKIQDAAVTAAKLATDAVTTAKIADGAVTAAKLATDSVTTIKIADANVTAAKLATDSVITAKIQDAAVTAAKLATDAVTTAKIADANVTTAKLADGSVTAAKLENTAVTPGSYTAADITVDAQGRITAAANGSATGYTNEEAQDAIFGGTCLGSTDSIELTYNDGANTATLDVKTRPNAELVGGTQGRVGIASGANPGLFVYLGSTSTTAGRGDYTPSSGQKLALQGRGGTPSASNLYLCERFDLLTAGTPASDTVVPILLNSESEAKKTTLGTIAALGIFRGYLGAWSEKTIATGAVTLDGPGAYLIDTAATSSSSSSSSTGGDPTDDLATINGLAEGEFALIRPADDARTIVVKHGTGNIEVALTSADVTLDDAHDAILVVGISGGVIALAVGSGGGGGAVVKTDYTDTVIEATDDLIFFDDSDTDNPKTTQANRIPLEVEAVAAGTSATLDITDRGKHFYHTTGSIFTHTIPPNASVAFPVGTVVEFSQHGVGQVRLTPGSGVTIRYPSDRFPRTRAQYSQIAIRKVATNTWVCMDDMEEVVPTSSSSGGSSSSSSSVVSSSSSSAPPSSSSSSSI